jgi:hypothetical protein
MAINGTHALLRYHTGVRMFTHAPMSPPSKPVTGSPAIRPVGTLDMLPKGLTRNRRFRVVVAVISYSSIRRESQRAGY